ncbi:MAG: hypothetical protein RL299_1816 [Pseudomonadota bacterium]|jgi:hypothetical protein
MTCCTPFNPAGSAVAASPSQHVNFTTGMVLGVEDYRAEFAYHSARDQWIMREAGGNGTLAGLDVSWEPTNPNGPSIRVTAGSAAAPSGQLICVARDQCAAINAWLATPEVATKVTAIASQNTIKTEALLSLWLTLRYVDCSALPVPIPGQPCRSEEDLMANSRVMDDYLLSLSFSSPLHSEWRAFQVLKMFEDAWVPDNSQPTDAAALDVLEGKLKKQLSALFGGESSLDAAALAPLAHHPTVRPWLRRKLRKLWITRARQLVMAQRCADSPRGEDCVLLARILVPVFKPGSEWQLAAGPVLIDESERSYIESPALAASLFGQAALPDPLPGEYQLLAEPGPGTNAIAATTAAALIRLDAAGEVTIPAGSAADAPRWLWLRSQGPGKVTLKVDGGGKIGTQPSRELSLGETVLLLADGSGNWNYGAGAPLS